MDLGLVQTIDRGRSIDIQWQRSLFKKVRRSITDRSAIANQSGPSRNIDSRPKTSDILPQLRRLNATESRPRSMPTEDPHLPPPKEPIVRERATVSLHISTVHRVVIKRVNSVSRNQPIPPSPPPYHSLLFLLVIPLFFSPLDRSRFFRSLLLRLGTILLIVHECRRRDLSRSI